MIKISGIMYGSQKIGIALRKLVSGDNEFEITVTDKAGERLYPGVFVVNREEAIQRYGIEVINKGNLRGIWIPLSDLRKK